MNRHCRNGVRIESRTGRPSQRRSCRQIEPMIDGASRAPLGGVPPIFGGPPSSVVANT